MGLAPNQTRGALHLLGRFGAEINIDCEPGHIDMEEGRTSYTSICGEDSFWDTVIDCERK